MASLRELIAQGRYELAAYRLLYGALCAYLELQGRRTNTVFEGEGVPQRNERTPVAGVKEGGRG